MSEDLSKSEDEEQWWYFVRHGQTEYNRLSIIQGSGVDTELNETGREQAQAFYKNYQDEGFDLVICSELQRTYQTILPFVEKELELLRFQQINEINWGIHEGKKSSPRMIESYKKVVANWKEENYDVRVEGGESARELADRLREFLAMLNDRSEKRTLICTHGRTLRCLMCLINDEPLFEMEKYQHSNTGLFLVKKTKSGLELMKNNDTTHLLNRVIG